MAINFYKFAVLIGSLLLSNFSLSKDYCLDEVPNFLDGVATKCGRGVVAQNDQFVVKEIFRNYDPNIWNIQGGEWGKNVAWLVANDLVDKSLQKTLDLAKNSVSTTLTQGFLDAKNVVETVALGFEIGGMLSESLGTKEIIKVIWRDESGRVISDPSLFMGEQIIPVGTRVRYEIWIITSSSGAFAAFPEFNDSEETFAPGVLFPYSTNTLGLTHDFLEGDEPRLYKLNGGSAFHPAFPLNFSGFEDLVGDGVTVYQVIPKFGGSIVVDGLSGFSCPGNGCENGLGSALKTSESMAPSSFYRTWFSSSDEGSKVDYEMSLYRDDSNFEQTGELPGFYEINSAAKYSLEFWHNWFLDSPISAEKISSSIEVGVLKEGITPYSMVAKYDEGQVFLDANLQSGELNDDSIYIFREDEQGNTKLVLTRRKFVPWVEANFSLPDDYIYFMGSDLSVIPGETYSYFAIRCVDGLWQHDTGCSRKSNIVSISIPELALSNTVNKKPIAIINSISEDLEVNKTLTFDGTGSYDPEGELPIYSWSLSAPTGSSASLSSTTSPTPSLTPDVEGTYTVSLMVNDGELQSETVRANVTVFPVAVEGHDLAVNAFASSGRFGSGNQVSFNIAIQNNGDFVEDVYVDVSLSGPINQNIGSFSLGEIQSGTSNSFDSFGNYSFPDTAPDGYYTLRARVYSPDGDSNWSNNTAVQTGKLGEPQPIQTSAYRYSGRSFDYDPNLDVDVSSGGDFCGVAGGYGPYSYEGYEISFGSCSDSDDYYYSISGNGFSSTGRRSSYERAYLYHDDRLLLIVKDIDLMSAIYAEVGIAEPEIIVNPNEAVATVGESVAFDINMGSGGDGSFRDNQSLFKAEEGRSWLFETDNDDFVDVVVRASGSSTSSGWSMMVTPLAEGTQNFALDLLAEDTYDYRYVIGKITATAPPVDSDNDEVYDHADAFPIDIAASVDTDGDGYPDAWNEGFTQADSTTGLVCDGDPKDAEIGADTDCDGVADSVDVFDNDPTEQYDSDSDGIGDNVDAFPSDVAASVDSDEDGYPGSWNVGFSQTDSTTGLVLDAYPSDSNEWADSDSDGIPDNTDNFPLDVAASVDTDGDGYPNAWNDGFSQEDSTSGLVLDLFESDPGEWEDSDSDGVGDNGDWAPLDDSEWADSDGDGVGDNTDWAVNDSSEWQDSDGDGVGDNADAAPHDENRIYNVAPQITEIADITIVAGDSVSSIVAVSDDDSDNASLEALLLPPFASFESNNLSISPLEEHVGEHQIVFVANDGFGGVDTLTVQIEVETSLPVISLSSPVEPIAVPFEVSSLIISGVATDANGSVAAVEFRREGGEWNTATGTDSWSLTLAGLTIGNTTIEIRGQDNNGDWGEITSTSVLREGTRAGWRYPRSDVTSTGSDETDYLPLVGSLEEQWGDIQVAPRVFTATGDVNADGTLELVTVSAGEIHILNSKGLEAFPSIPIPVTSDERFILEDVNRDGANEIIVGTHSSSNLQLNIFSASGDLISNLSTTGGTDSSMWPVAYLGDDRLLVAYNSEVATDPRGIGLWNVREQSELWFFDVGPCVSDVSVADAPDEGSFLIIYSHYACHEGGVGSGVNGTATNTSDDSLFTQIIDENGSEVYFESLGSDITSGEFGTNQQILSDLDFDGEIEVVNAVGDFLELPSYSRVFAREIGVTAPASTTGMRANANPEILVSDVNMNGEKEVIAWSNLDSSFSMFRHSGGNNVGLITRNDTGGGDGFQVFATADYNGDFEKEIIAKNGTALTIYSGEDLSEISRYDIGSEITNIITSDLNGDGIIEIIVTGIDGETRVFSDFNLTNPVVSLFSNEISIREFLLSNIEELVFDFTITSDSDGAKIESLTIQGEGELDEVSDVGAVKLYWDSNGNQRWDSEDTLLDEKSYSEDNSTLEFDFASVQLFVGDTRFFVTYQLR